MRLERMIRRLRGPASPEEATLEELVGAFCDPWKAQRLERRWARTQARRR